jgi:hypothetical protein
MHPCGTPDLILQADEIVVPIFTHTVRSNRKFEIQDKDRPVRPMFSSFFLARDVP